MVPKLASDQARACRSIRPAAIATEVLRRPVLPGASRSASVRRIATRRSSPTPTACVSRANRIDTWSAIGHRRL